MQKLLIIVLICYSLVDNTIYAARSSSQIHDPTRPADYSNAEEVNPWELNAVIISSDRRIAVINGKSVRVGDEINGEKVISINHGSVTIGNAADTMTLYLLEKPVKRKTTN